MNSVVIKGKILPAGLVKDFIFGGQAKVVFTNPVSKNSFKYLIQKSKHNDGVYFVRVFHNIEYIYIGIIKDNKFSTTKNSGFTPESKQVKGFAWVIDRVISNLDISCIEVRHHGQCSCCGKTLTDLDSINYGFGPVCFKKLKGMSFKQWKELQGAKALLDERFNEWAGFKVA